VVLTLGTGGRLQAGYLVNEDYKSFDLLKEIIPLLPGASSFIIPPPADAFNN
jgi:hypothetical protein